jgi:hypothetical protein
MPRHRTPSPPARPAPVSVDELTGAILRMIVEKFGNRPVTWETAAMALRVTALEIKQAAIDFPRRAVWLCSPALRPARDAARLKRCCNMQFRIEQFTAKQQNFILGLLQIATRHQCGDRSRRQAERLSARPRSRPACRTTLGTSHYDRFSSPEMVSAPSDLAVSSIALNWARCSGDKALTSIVRAALT